MLQRLAQRLNLEPAELVRAVWLGGTLFALTGSYTLVKTARDVLFLSRLPATTLPYVFLGVAALAFAVSLAFTRATRSRPLSESLAAAALGVALSLAVFAYLFRLNAGWVPVAFYLWVNVYGLILISQFWVYTNALSDPREAKRTFGIIGGGGILGGLFGGLVASPLTRHFSLASLLIVAAVLVALIALRVAIGLRSGAQPTPETPHPDGEPGATPLGHPYLRWLALAALCSVLVTSLLDFQFKVEIQRRFPSGVAMASFLGGYYTMINLASLGVQLFLTRWALQAFGAGWSAAVLPGGLGLGAALTLVAPGFGSVLASRLWDQVMRQSVNRSAVELFYFPLEPGLRRRAKSMIEAGLERVGDGLAGLVILAVGATLGATTWTLGLPVAALVVAWVAAWLGVRRGYVRELGRNLRRMNLEHHREPVSLREASVLQETERLLESPYERVVLQSMELLEQNAPERLEPRLGSLMSHPLPAVRARAVAIAAPLRALGLGARIQALLRDPDPAVRIEALRSHCTAGGEDAASRMEEFIASEDPRIREAAILLAAEFAPPGDELRLGAILERLIRDGSPGERAIVARALGKRAAPSSLHDLLAPLLRDPDLETRRAAFRSAGCIQRRAHIPVLIEGLAAGATLEAARAGLAGFGDLVAGTLGDTLADASVAPEVRLQIPYVLSDIRTQEALLALLRCHDRGNVRLWYRVLKAQNRIRASGARVVFPRERVTQDLEQDVRSYLFAYAHYRACPIDGKHSAERLLCVVLNERLEQSLNRAFRRLSLLYRPEDIQSAYRGIESGQPRLRGNALEYLENALATDHRALVLPLVDDSGDEGRLRLAESRFGIRFVGYEQTLGAILEGDDQWLRVCALYVVGARKEQSLREQVRSAAGSLDAWVRDTASWASLALEAG